MNKYSKAAIVPIVFGIILLIVGSVIAVPGGALTTKESMNNQTTDYYTFDTKYSAIDEYVGGDAYNFIIGASLVAGKMAGAMISRTIYFAAGIICICIGITMLFIKENDQKTMIVQQVASEPKPAPVPDQTAKEAAPAEEEKLPEL